MSSKHAQSFLPYRNRIRCVGVTGKYPSTGCDGTAGHMLFAPTRYSVGPIPAEPDERKSPRCPNCGGLVVEVARIDSEGIEYTLDDPRFEEVLKAQQARLEALRKEANRVRPATQQADMRLTTIPLGGVASCAGCGEPTMTHLYLGTVCPDGTKLGNTRGICDTCRLALAETLLAGLEH